MPRRTYEDTDLHPLLGVRMLSGGFLADRWDDVALHFPWPTEQVHSPLLCCSDGRCRDSESYREHVRWELGLQDGEAKQLELWPALAPAAGPVGRKAGRRARRAARAVGS